VGNQFIQTRRLLPQVVRGIREAVLRVKSAINRLTVIQWRKRKVKTADAEKYIVNLAMEEVMVQKVTVMLRKVKLTMAIRVGITFSTSNALQLHQDI
jgi:hypothetical protein